MFSRTRVFSEDSTVAQQQHLLCILDACYPTSQTLCYFILGVPALEG